MKSINDLIPYAKNARTHSESQVSQIAASIVEFGFTNPILIDGNEGIIAGHGRLMAAKQLGINTVPVVVLDHLCEEQKRAYIIADNKLAELAGWDEELLGSELVDMTFTDPPYNVNYGDTAKDKIRSKGGAKAGRKIMNDNLGQDFAKFLTDVCKNIIKVTKGACYICMSSSELHSLQKAFVDADGHWSTFIVWAKNVFTIGSSNYQRQYEAILYGWPKGNDHYWCGARNQSD
jgi:hypothetical protein